MTDAALAFEQGPIRPPNESRSLLLRLTRNCPWNHCLFCPVYKRRKFSLRSVAEIRQDIQTARAMADEIAALSQRLGAGGQVDDRVIRHILNAPDLDDSYRSVALWLYYGTDACFLQDADNLIMKTDDLVAVVAFLREAFPRIRRVTTYTRSKTVLKKSVEALKRIRAAGLDRIHIGLESGSDDVLRFMKKGVTGDEHVAAGKRVLAAGMELSEYVMPGLGGQAMARAHALDTADVLNRIDPHFIRLRTLRVPRRVPLYQELEAGTFTMQTDDQTIAEIRLLIESLEGITSTVASDHFMNLLEEVSGTLPDDKARMLAVIDHYQDLSDLDRLVFRAGRRGGRYRSLDDLTRDRATYEKVHSLVESMLDTGGEAGVEKMIRELVDPYV
ncbi:MAG: radical SAM protein [Desulfosarcina sp.]|nr:radical SAM protein [Desulfosarcina sp.]MBC2745166.1 radical SAM protein [Desulfosarcina sp.]MBC2768073.1 radical SAM protein [Desulfosarcina sp.]